LGWVTAEDSSDGIGFFQTLFFSPEDPTNFKAVQNTVALLQVVLEGIN
jgi:hypothetical protein